MRRFLIIGVLIGVGLTLLAVSHRLTDTPRGSVRVTFADDPSTGAMRTGGLRFDILRVDFETLIDSLAQTRILDPDAHIIHAIEDTDREEFLRGVIERKNFLLSSPASQALSEAARSRSVYMDSLRTQPFYETLTGAIARVHGPVLELSDPPVFSIHPLRLRNEVRLYNPDRPELFDENAGPDIPTRERYTTWLKAVDRYEKAYHQDLLERTLVTVSVYRNRSVASAQADSTGQAIFPPLVYGRYWVVGHYPQEPLALSRANRLLRLQTLSPDFTQPDPLFIWNAPFELAGGAASVELAPHHLAPLFP